MYPLMENYKSFNVLQTEIYVCLVVHTYFVLVHLRKRFFRSARVLSPNAHFATELVSSHTTRSRAMQRLSMQFRSNGAYVRGYKPLLSNLTQLDLPPSTYKPFSCKSGRACSRHAKHSPHTTTTRTSKPQEDLRPVAPPCCPRVPPSQQFHVSYRQLSLFCHDTALRATPLFDLSSVKSVTFFPKASRLPCAPSFSSSSVTCRRHSPEGKKLGLAVRQREIALHFSSQDLPRVLVTGKLLLKGFYNAQTGQTDVYISNEALGVGGLLQEFLYVCLYSVIMYCFILTFVTILICFNLGYTAQDE